jgi:2-methylcitrate dehydratase PrpD
MNETRILADFCYGLKLKDVPEEIVRKTKLCLLDYVANVYGSLELDAVKSVVSYMRSLGSDGPASALGCGFKTSLPSAAFINGTTAEAIEAQDGLRFGGNHPVCAVMPAAFALAETNNSSGVEFLEAIIAGYETADRAAAAMHPYHTLSGFLPTGTCGTFGAAAAAAKLMKLNPAGMLNALGNAGYLLPITMAEQLMGGYTIKIVQGGQAASAGITAAGLAAEGITGCPEVLEGSSLKGGFTQITSKVDPKPERITEKLGEHFTIADLYFKPFTACRHTHGAAQATLSLLREKKFSFKDVDSVNVATYGMAEVAVGKGMPENGTIVSAQFSIPYVVAACLIDNELGPLQLTEKRITDPEILALSRKVIVKADDELNKVYPEKTSSRVEIILRNGEKLSKQVDIPKGDPRDPMDEKDLVEKIRRFAGNRFASKIDKVASMIMDIENLKDIKCLAEAI